MSTWRILEGDVRVQLATLPADSIHTVMTSPPYFGLRSYDTEPQVWGGSDPACAHEWQESRYYVEGGGGAGSSGEAFHEPGPENAERIRKARWREDAVCRKCEAWLGNLGLEPSPFLYVQHLVEVFRAVRRVLRPEGTCWLNLGDSFCSNGGARTYTGLRAERGDEPPRPEQVAPEKHARWRRDWGGIKTKDLIGMPWRVAFALQEDGWWLRSDIVWCLSGGTWVYAKTAKGETVTMVRDLARLAPESVQLWNGSRWTRLLGMSMSPRSGNEVEIVLRSGERISCTTTHRFPTARGLLAASEMRPGDVLSRVALPEPENPRDCALDEDAAWFAGLYLAEGSRAGSTIQIAGHAKEEARWERVQRVSRKYGGSATRTVSGNCMNIRVYGRVLFAILDELVSGRTAHDKAFAPVVWRYSNRFLAAFVLGYLEGDGHWDAKNRRWRLGFCRNYSLERDLRVACARLGYTLTLNPGWARFQNGRRSTFKGEIRTERSGHHNDRDMGEIIEIRKARCREVWDLGVADEPHVFALASGVLTHNSKPNPMPESVEDRPTRSHEFLFLLAKSERYFFDRHAVLEPLRSNMSDLRKVIEKKNRIGGKHKETEDPLLKSSGATHIGQKRSVGDAEAAAARLAEMQPKNPTVEMFPGVTETAPVERSDSSDAPRKQYRHEGAVRVGREAIANPNRMWGDPEALERMLQGRNIRSVWEIATEPCPEAHFATFPKALVIPCVKAGSSEHGCCPECGAPWRRVVVAAGGTIGKDWSRHPNTREANLKYGASIATKSHDGTYRRQDAGWEPTCKCGQEIDTGGFTPEGQPIATWRPHEPVPCTVLDPFAGSGTTLLVANCFGRNAIGTELNPEYAQIARRRLAGNVPLFAHEA